MRLLGDETDGQMKGAKSAMSFGLAAVLADWGDLGESSGPRATLAGKTLKLRFSASWREWWIPPCQYALPVSSTTVHCTAPIVVVRPRDRFPLKYAPGNSQFTLARITSGILRNSLHIYT